MPTLADLFSGKPFKDVGAAVYRFVSSPTAVSSATHLLPASTCHLLCAAKPLVCLPLEDLWHAMRVRWHSGDSVCGLAVCDLTQLHGARCTLCCAEPWLLLLLPCPSTPQVLLALGIALVVFIVILAKKALKSITDQELAREKAEAEAAAAAAAAEAAEEGTAGEQHQEQKQPDCVNGQKVPLPLAVDSKLAAAAAPTSCGASGSSVGDLQVIVADDSGIQSQDSSLSMSRSSNNSLIATAPVPPAAADDQAGSSMSSRTSSISSMMGLLSARFQRSS